MLALLDRIASASPLLAFVTSQSLYQTPPRCSLPFRDTFVGVRGRLQPRGHAIGLPIIGKVPESAALLYLAVSHRRGRRSSHRRSGPEIGVPPVAKISASDSTYRSLELQSTISADSHPIMVNEKRKAVAVRHYLSWSAPDAHFTGPRSMCEIKLWHPSGPKWVNPHFNIKQSLPSLLAGKHRVNVVPSRPSSHPQLHLDLERLVNPPVQFQLLQTAHHLVKRKAIYSMGFPSNAKGDVFVPWC